MVNDFIPVWLLGGPFIGLLILAFSFKGPSAMPGGRGTRYEGREPLERKNAIYS
jgi:hypothetical protein